MDRVVVVGASAGGVEALRTLVAALPADFPAAVLIVMHIGERPSILPQLLARYCALPVEHARAGQRLRAGQVLVAPPNHHLLLKREDGAVTTVLSTGPKENFYRPAIDSLFRSAAAACGTRVAGVILTGYLDDGVAGLQAIKACGGHVIVQDPADASVPDMPRNALNNVDVDRCLPVDDIGAALVGWARSLAVAAPDTPVVPDWVDAENRCAEGGSELALVQRLGSPSAYSCPECGGSLFTMHHARPGRLRCHTGHSYTMRILLHRQVELIENTLLTAVRALQEKEHLAEQLAAEYAGRDIQAEPGFAKQARHARADAARVRRVMLRQQRADLPAEDAGDPRQE